jgi:Sulfotransferase family
LKRTLSLAIIRRIVSALRTWNAFSDRLRVDELMERACAKTGYSDFGTGGFKTPLAILVSEFNRDPHLNVIGRIVARQNLLQTLVNRLRIQRTLKANPHIGEVKISRPVVIVGLPRTGTSMLHTLLAQDPAARYLRYWEISSPCPPPSPQNDLADPRIRRKNLSIQIQDFLLPTVKAAHAVDATSPEECRLLFRQSFACQFLYYHLADIPEYMAWLRGRNLSEQYHYYHDQLQLLTCNYPDRHLVLKSPSHLWNLDALLEVMPDAALIQTHRDPVESLASQCSLTCLCRSGGSDYVNRDWIRDNLLATYEDGLQRSADWRLRHPHRMVDVCYDELVRDPLRVVRRVYDQIGRELTPEMERRVRQWIRANPQHKHGKHQYSASQFSLQTVRDRPAFTAYQAQFVERSKQRKTIEAESLGPVSVTND